MGSKLKILLALGCQRNRKEKKRNNAIMLKVEYSFTSKEMCHQQMAIITAKVMSGPKQNVRNK